MSSIFCCDSVCPYRPARLSHEDKFESFLVWAKQSQSSPVADSASFFQAPNALPPFAVQFVQQVNYGPIEAKRYFIPSPGTAACGNKIEFLEVVEQDLLVGNFEKLNSYKNFKCSSHNKFFELNLYQKDPINRHHWRLNIARPGGDIDL
ncbi:uncharacterized protein N7459_002692 [Penicillium hispanicum]|uniref:uncharacterized protein n=1 Tax=Penicillium hispanicum TaxID=1080232 RepID=UPI00254128F7|nr:uncharacterized protein N7459_002692 [Penicillium hispanicum]KAJ5586927.1 hypothetical protein N7459_002692 [Penicillium hispanicum]